MGLPIEEQELVLQFSRDNDICKIYTSDKTQMTRLDKLYKCVQEDCSEGEVVAKHYECDKRFISFRSDPDYKPEYVPKRQISEEHLEKLRKGRDTA